MISIERELTAYLFLQPSIEGYTIYTTSAPENIAEWNYVQTVLNEHNIPYREINCDEYIDEAGIPDRYFMTAIRLYCCSSVHGREVFNNKVATSGTDTGTLSCPIVFKSCTYIGGFQELWDDEDVWMTPTQPEGQTTPVNRSLHGDFVLEDMEFDDEDDEDDEDYEEDDEDYEEEDEEDDEEYDEELEVEPAQSL